MVTPDHTHPPAHEWKWAIAPVPEPTAPLYEAAWHRARMQADMAAHGRTHAVARPGPDGSTVLEWVDTHLATEYQLTDLQRRVIAHWYDQPGAQLVMRTGRNGRPLRPAHGASKTPVPPTPYEVLYQRIVDTLNTAHPDVSFARAWLSDAGHYVDLDAPHPYRYCTTPADTARVLIARINSRLRQEQQ